MSHEHLKLDALTPQELAAHVTAAMAQLAASGAEVSALQAVIFEAAKRYVDQTRTPAGKQRLVVISPDKDTDYCYLDMSREEALGRFNNSDDGALYDQTAPSFKVTESEIGGSFMLWRNIGNNMADMLNGRMPPELVDLLRGPQSP